MVGICRYGLFGRSPKACGFGADWVARVVPGDASWMLICAGYRACCGLTNTILMLLWSEGTRVISELSMAVYTSNPIYIKLLCGGVIVVVSLLQTTWCKSSRPTLRITPICKDIYCDIYLSWSQSGQRFPNQKHYQRGITKPTIPPDWVQMLVSHKPQVEEQKSIYRPRFLIDLPSCPKLRSYVPTKYAVSSLPISAKNHPEQRQEKGKGRLLVEEPSKNYAKNMPKASKAVTIATATAAATAAVAHPPTKKVTATTISYIPSPNQNEDLPKKLRSLVKKKKTPKKGPN